jgi:hypothetical protein
MDLIEQLEVLRIPLDEILKGTFTEQQKFSWANEMLDNCLEIVWKWLIKEGYIK